MLYKTTALPVSVMQFKADKSIQHFSLTLRAKTLLGKFPKAFAVEVYVLKCALLLCVYHISFINDPLKLSPRLYRLCSIQNRNIQAQNEIQNVNIHLQNDVEHYIQHVEK